MTFRRRGDVVAWRGGARGGESIFRGQNLRVTQKPPADLVLFSWERPSTRLSKCHRIAASSAQHKRVGAARCLAWRKGELSINEMNSYTHVVVDVVVHGDGRVAGPGRHQVQERHQQDGGHRLERKQTMMMRRWRLITGTDSSADNGSRASRQHPADSCREY